MNFSTIEDSYNYYYPNDRIINKYIYKQSTYVLCSNSDDVIILNYKKNNNNWSYSKLNSNFYNYGKYSIKFYNIKYDDISIVVIMANFHKNEIHPDIIQFQ